MHTNVIAQKSLASVKSHRYSLRSKQLIEPAASYYPSMAENNAIPFTSNNIPKKIPTERQQYTNKPRTDK
jgi:hypothetical protein